MNSHRGFLRVLLEIGVGYSRSLRRVVWALLLIAAAVAVSAGIVFPLWYFSTHDRVGYTTAVLALAAAAALFLLVRRLRIFWQLPSSERAVRVRRVAGRVGAVLGYLFGAYIIFGLYVVGFLAAAVPLSVAYLLVLGYTLYARRSRARR